MIWAPDGLNTVTDLIGRSSALKLSWVVVVVTMVVADEGLTGKSHLYCANQ